jgi:hypothetical protein
MIFLSVQLNPIFTYALICIVTEPFFKRLEKTYKKAIEKSLENDYKIDYYKPKKLAENGLPGSEKQGRCLVGVIEDLWNGPFIDFFWSIGLLVTLIWLREPLTPDVLHFVTCMVEEEAHFLWVMGYWLCYKCSLTISPEEKVLMSASQVLTQRFKVVVRGALEVMAALVITRLMGV